MAHMLTTTQEMQNFITNAIASGLDKFLPALIAQNNKIEKEIFNLTEAASYLNMSPHTLRKKVDEKKITYIQDERILQFRKKPLDNYLDKFTIKN
ncbi:MAG: helix-turn-helix domain-containing protein [Bacteroidetes bacterium]|nr:helix-turn-helix domain-containing protein [Bacteroidota bacterium]